MEQTNVDIQTRNHGVHISGVNSHILVGSSKLSTLAEIRQSLRTTLPS